MAALLLAATACIKSEPVVPPSSQLGNIVLTIGGKTFTAELEQNNTAEAFLKLLPATYTMTELNGNEKYHYLDTSLPTNRTSPDTIHAGDLMLYSNNCLVLFYETFSTSYSYSPIGHITVTDSLKETLGNRNVQIHFSTITHNQK